MTKQQRIEAYRKSCYLVRLQRQEFDPQTGKQKFAPFEQYFTPSEFKLFQQYPNGHTIVDVIYDPTADYSIKGEDGPEDEKPRTTRRK
jgi:hypothetical protein